MRLLCWLKRAIGVLLFAAVPLTVQAQSAASAPATIPVPHLDPVLAFETMSGASGVSQGNFTFVIAHRGFHSEPGCAENSYCAIRAAYEAGADGIELDVKLSSDNVAVLGHDNTVGRELADWDGALAAPSWGPFQKFPLIDPIYRYFGKLPFLLKFGGADDPGNPQRKMMQSWEMMDHHLRDQFNETVDDTQIDVRSALRRIVQSYPMMIWLDVKNTESLDRSVSDIAFIRDLFQSNAIKYVGFKLPLSIVKDVNGNPSEFYGVSGLKYFLVIGSGDFDYMVDLAKELGYYGEVNYSVNFILHHYCKSDNGCLGIEIAHKYPDAPTQEIYDYIRFGSTYERWQTAAFHTVPQYDWYDMFVSSDDKAVNYGRWYPRTDGSCCFSPTDTLNSSSKLSREVFASPDRQASEGYDLRPSYNWNEDNFTFITTDDPTRVLRELSAKSHRSKAIAGALGGSSTIPSGGDPQNIGHVPDGVYKVKVLDRYLKELSGFVGAVPEAQCEKECLWYVRTRPNKSYTITNVVSGYSAAAGDLGGILVEPATGSNRFLWSLGDLTPVNGGGQMGVSIQSVASPGMEATANTSGGYALMLTPPLVPPNGAQLFTLIPAAGVLPEVSRTGGPPGYAFCADANGSPPIPAGSAIVACNIDGPTSLAFGADGRWTYKDVDQHGLFECKADNFDGVDNAAGVRKACFFAPRIQAGQLSGFFETVPCAAELGQCALGSTPREIAFGVRLASGEMAFTYARASGGFNCSLTAFPTDPAPGQAKSCYLSKAASPVGPDGYVACAQSADFDVTSDICSFRGTALVAYGADGTYTYKTLANSARCNSKTFGVDLALSGKRSCFYKFMGPQVIKPFGANCAVEGGVCFDGLIPALVAYGVDDQWFIKDSEFLSTLCNSSNFGDPKPGFAKSCRTVPSPFKVCARDGGTCTTPKGALLVYGSVSGLDTLEPSKLIYKPHLEGGDITCSSATFGSDPAPDRMEYCFYYQLLVPQAPPAGFTWCAKEATVCNIGAGHAASVALGAYGHFVYLPSQTGDIVCSVTSFGGTDPMPGVEKGCFYRLY